MASRGKLEREITVPTGGWSFVLSEDNSDVGTVTLAAGETYYWSSNGSEGKPFADGLNSSGLKDAIEAVGSGTYSVFPYNGEGAANGTGKLQITVTGGASVWGFHTFKQNGVANNALRDLLGFDADITTDVATATGANHVQGLWLNSGTWKNKFGEGDYGWIEANTRSSESASGDVSVIGGGRTKRVMQLRFEGVTHARMRTSAEVTTNESLETFYQNDMLGQKAYCAQPGGPFRWYQDADTDGTYTTIKIPDVAKHDPEAMREDWVGRWNFTLTRCVVQS